MATKCPKCHFENPDDTFYCGKCATPLAGSKEPLVSKTITIQQPQKFISKGTVLAGKYRIIEPIGKGGMGIVYKAEDIKLERTVALKFLPAELTEDPEARERFVREAKAAAALSHNHICTIHEIGEDENQYFIAMEYIGGQSLKEKILEGPFDQTEALDIVIQVAEGLKEAHEKGIIHRDIKPGNIMVTDKSTAKVMDFGLAKVFGASLITKEAKTMGTVAYMSPEQAQGQSVDHRTDIWSLGVILYEMLTGQLPFKGEFDQSMIHSILHHEPEPLTKAIPTTPKTLENVVFTALAKNSADRYQSMAEFLEDLKSIGEGLKPARAKVGLFRGRVLGIKKVYAYPVVACLVAIIVLAGLFLLPKRGQVYDSIAVLPFLNLSPNPEPGDASDMLTDELISKLFAVGSLRVVPFRQVIDYRNVKKSYREIGKELKVRAIVDPTIASLNNLDRVNIGLWDSETDTRIFNQVYEHEAGDIQILLGEVAGDLVREVGVISTPEVAKLLASSQTVNRQAYDSYLKAKKILESLYSSGPKIREALQSAYQELQKSIAIDPQFAPAQWALVDYFGNKIFMGFISFIDAEPQVRTILNKALALDPDSWEAHFALGKWKMNEWDWEGARKDLKRAVELAPGNAEVAGYHSYLLQHLGRFEEAITESKRAVGLDPLDPTFLPQLGLSLAYLNSRQYGRAISILGNLIESDPNSLAGHNQLGMAYAWSGRGAEAVAVAEKMQALLQNSDYVYFHLCIAQFYACAGQREKALKIIDAYLGSQKEELIDSFMIAEVYSVLGEKDEAFKWLEHAYQNHSNQMMALKIDPPLDNIRSDPRYKEYLKKAGFEP